MKFLIDESCDVVLSRALLKSGYDVLDVREFAPGATDEMVMKLAVSEKRILITEDKDFGRLIYAHGHKATGVIFLRYSFTERDQITDRLVDIVKQRNQSLFGCFVTIAPHRIRIGRLP